MTDMLNGERLEAVIKRAWVQAGLSSPIPRLVVDAAPAPNKISGSVPLDLPRTLPSFYRSRGKRALDVGLVLATAPVSLALIGVCALALWIEGGRPFYSQDRLGRDGRRFSILKLRTMVRDADERLKDLIAADPALKAEWDSQQKLRHDPRITPVGRVLRATSLDELPQLWNVLRGQMSLVGPRPMMPEQLPLYGDPAIYFDLRPGLTGLWQVSARNEAGFSERYEKDALYHESMSPLRDLWLMLRTVGVVFRRTGY